MKRSILYTVTILIALNAHGQDVATFRSISDEIMMHEYCYDNLRTLCKTIGHRISGSPAAARAVAWGEQAMIQAGADKVWLQPVDVPQWIRGKESLRLKAGNGKYKNVAVLSLGNSVGTNGKQLEAPVIIVHNFEELKQIPAAQVKGKIVFFDYRFRQDIINTFEGYGDAVRYRAQGPSAASAKGAVAVIIRSVSTGLDDFPHTGSTHYTDSIPAIPAVAIGNISADSLENEFAKGKKVTAELETYCKMSPQLVRSYNVIGEIKGAEYPDEIIVVGGHLDSWDVGEGANDDGSGCVQSIEVIRAIKALGLRPKRTIRAVLFMNEENGLKGGIAYADSAKAHNENHVLAIETDAGSFSPRGFGLVMDQEKKDRITYFKNLFLPYGVYDFTQEDDGADISPLKQQGVPLAGLMPDPQRYFDYHHSNNDIFENVNHRELKLGAVALTQLVYLISEYGLK